MVRLGSCPIHLVYFLKLCYNRFFIANLKNEIVGHEQRKELAVVHGVVKPLAGLLRTEARKGGKRRRATNGSGGIGREREGERAQQWTTEDELRFQATLVVGSLANGESSAIEVRGRFEVRME